MEAIKDNKRYKEITKGKSYVQTTAEERSLIDKGSHPWRYSHADLVPDSSTRSLCNSTLRIVKAKRESVSQLLWSLARHTLTASDCELEDLSFPPLPSPTSAPLVTSSSNGVTTTSNIASSRSRSLFPLPPGRDRRDVRPKLLPLRDLPLTLAHP